MNSRKDTKELLELLDTTEESDTDEVLEYFDDVVPFISKFNIQHGENTVTGALLYKLYRSYSKNPLTVNKFHNIMVRYLPDSIYDYSRKKGHRRLYRLNLTALRVSSELFKLTTKKTQKLLTSERLLNHFRQFKDEVGLKDGDKWVEVRVIYKCYKRYCASKNKRHVLSERRFGQLIEVHFKHTRLNEVCKWVKATEEYLKYVKKEEIKDLRKKRREGKLRQTNKTFKRKV